MITISVSNCPLSLRGDLTKWLVEINTGIYVGNVNAKVREELWKRICENINLGQATMVYSTNNEQGFSFKVHNTSWIPKDYEGITLMKIPLKSGNQLQDSLKNGFSKAAKFELAKKAKMKSLENNFVILDLETTGLDIQSDRIIEIGALKIENNTVTEEFSCLVESENRLDEKIVSLTGITDKLIKENGISENEAIKKLAVFINGETVIGYNIKFDIAFLESSADRVGVGLGIKKTKDLLGMVRKKVDGIVNYKLTSVAEYFSIDKCGMHRALKDCYVMYEIYNKLNKK